jgi:hypothetical protein
VQQPGPPRLRWFEIGADAFNQLNGARGAAAGEVERLSPVATKAR